jgi:hypothetical protein
MAATSPRVRLSVTRIHRSNGSRRPAAAVLDWWVEPVPYVPGTPSTGGLFWVRGSAQDAGDRWHWSIFVKVLQSPSRWEHIDDVPEQLRELLLDSFPWRLELDVLASDIARRLPEDVRQPATYDVHEIADDLVAIWMEDVQQTSRAWDLDRFRRAARALGRLAARRRADRAEPFRPGDPMSRSPGYALRYYTEGRVLHGAVEPLRDDAMWGHPTLAAALAATHDVELRSDYIAASRRIPELLNSLDTLPQTYVHGDASPQNLLVPAAAPDSFVVIDWGFDSPHAIGFDLGQLLIGLIHAGELTAEALPAIHEVILSAYLDGVGAEGMAVSDADVRDGYVGSLVVRSAFTALPIELLQAPAPLGDDVAAASGLWIERVRLTRYLLDLAATLPSRR